MSEIFHFYIGNTQSLFTLLGKPSQANISIIDRKARSVRIVIQVDKGEGFKDMLLSYRPEGGEIVRKSILKNQSYVDVDRLNPFTTYEFNVTAINEFFESDGQRKTLKTAEDGNLFLNECDQSPTKFLTCFRFFLHIVHGWFFFLFFQTPMSQVLRSRKCRNKDFSIVVLKGKNAAILHSVKSIRTQ